MFNELTLALHILLLILIYAFLLLAVRVISRDLSSTNLTSKNGERQSRLIVLKGEGMGGVAEYPIVEELLIGRASDCDVVIDNAFVSAHHARVYTADTGYWLEDLGSTNGTTVNGKPVEGPVRMGNGGKFMIGDHEFKFVD